MNVMARKKSESATDGKRFPSRENTKYVGIGADLYAMLELYAEENSTPDEKRSISWAARKAIRKFFTDLGKLPVKKQEAPDG